MWFTLLLKNWRPILAGIAFAVILSMGVHIYESGKAAGAQAQRISQLEDDKKQVLGALQQTNATLAQQGALLKQLSSQLADSQQRYSALATQKAVASQQVASLPAASVQGDLEKKAGGPLADPETLRKIDDAYTQLPIVRGQLTELGNQVTLLDQKVTATETQRDSAISAYNTLLPAYSRAYNAAQRHHGLFVKIITLGLVHDRKLELPDPLTLPKVGQ